MIAALANSKLCAPLEIRFPSSVARGHFGFCLLNAHWRKHVGLILFQSKPIQPSILAK